MRMNLLLAALVLTACAHRGPGRSGDGAPADVGVAAAAAGGDEGETALPPVELSEAERAQCEAWYAEAGLGEVPTATVATRLDEAASRAREAGRYVRCRKLVRCGLALHPPPLQQAELRATEGHSLVDQRAYARAEPLYRHALALFKAQLGPDHPRTATSLNKLAFLLQTTGRYAEAEPLHRRALAIYEAQLGPDHPETATSLNNLALLLN